MGSDQAIAEKVAEVRRSIAFETQRWAPELLKIVPKGRSHGLVRFELNDGQLAFERKLAEQREAGKPLRAIILKARQIGFSTLMQGKLILAATQLAHLNALCVADSKKTGAKLYRIGERMYNNLPHIDVAEGYPLVPPVRSHRTNEFLHFAPKGEAWEIPDMWPDSTYWVDTAGEFESGRGGTYHFVHLSEYAFWEQAETKFRALMQAVPRDPDTLVVIESTANGYNHFRELWMQAEAGDSEFLPFFWPWWKHAEYSLPFPTERARREFRPGDTEQSPYAEGERELLDPGPIDVLTGEHVPLTLEQLNWRRWCIADNCGGNIRSFDQEYPTTPEHAFIASGEKVFEPVLVRRVIAQTERTDPRHGPGGPVRGAVVATKRELRAGLHGRIDVPLDPEFRPARLLDVTDSPDWRVWLPTKDDVPEIDPEAAYVIGVDVSDGMPESGEGDPAYQAIEVIDHATRVQVAEYRSRVAPDLLAEHAVLTAMLFNNAWLAIEKTGPGLAVVRKIWHDFRYPFVYRRKQHQQSTEKQTENLGWSTDSATKPLLIAGGQELLREEAEEGAGRIKSRRLAREFSTYVRTSARKTQPEAGEYADLLMAWLIAQQVAAELPIRRAKKKDDEKGRPRRRPITARYTAFRRGRPV